MLLGLVDQNIERLSAKLEVHQENAEAQAERTVSRLSFDPSPEGEALRNYLVKCTSTLFRGMATYRDYKAKTKAASHADSGAEPRAFPDERSQGPRRADHESNGSKLAALDPFGSGDGHDDRSERADAIDSDSVQQHRDDMIAIAEIDENATNEANFAETIRSTEVQESIQLTADSAALSELDNCREAAIEQESGERSKESKKTVARSPAVYSLLATFLAETVARSPAVYSLLATFLAETVARAAAVYSLLATFLAETVARAAAVYFLLTTYLKNSLAGRNPPCKMVLYYFYSKKSIPRADNRFRHSFARFSAVTR